MTKSIIENALALRIVRGLKGWKPISSAPKDHEIVVYAPPYQDLPDMVSFCRWHPDAGFCIDELRQPTLWLEKPV